MTNGPRPGWEAMGSLLSESFLATPQAGRLAAEAAAEADPANRIRHLTDVAYAALLAGEPKRARRVLDQIGSATDAPDWARHLAAMRLWAAQLDANWYPGNVGSETPIVGDDVDLTLAPSPGPYETVLVEHVVTRGPVCLLTQRALIDVLLRHGYEETAANIANFAIGNLQALINYATSLEAPEMACWALLAQAALLRRTGRDQGAVEMLDGVRTAAREQGLAAVLVLTYLTEADWWATPGSSPEALGFDLASKLTPSKRATDDEMERVDRCLSAAEELLETGRAAVGPGVFTALHLRRATLAWLRTDHDSQRTHLEAALALARRNEGGATVRLLEVHILVADLAEGRLGERLADIGSGWGPAASGPLVETRHWAETCGSTSWCVGLGRLLERAGDLWKEQGEHERASLAYLAALQLLEADSRVPLRTLSTAVAELDTDRNLTSRALVRLERLLMTIPRIFDVREQIFDVFQELEILSLLIWAQRPRQRTAAAEHAARGLERVRTRLRASVNEVARAAEVTPGTPFAEATGDVGQLSEIVEGQNVTLPDSLDAHNTITALLAQVRELLEILEVLIPLSRGEHAQRRGLIEEAEQWFQAALAAAERTETWLVALVLVTAERLEEAREHVFRTAESRSLRDHLVAVLALRADVLSVAEEAFERAGADPATPRDWRVALTGADLALRRGDAARALRLSEAGIAWYEDALSRMLRDTDRVAACDDPDVTSLYLTAAKALLGLAREDGASADQHLARAFEVTEQARSLSIAHLLGERLPELSDAEDRNWREAAATWAAEVDRLLAAIDASPPADTKRLLDAVDAADARLRNVEARIERAAPGILVQRNTPKASVSLASVQERLPAGAVLLEYHALGTDLLVAAVSSDGVVVEHRCVSSRRLSAAVYSHHRRCAYGWGTGTAADELASSLLEPVADTLREHRRLVIVPFGPLNLVPFHALQFDGAPLGSTHVVSYAPSAGVAVSSPFDQGLHTGSTAIVGDPAFDQHLHPRLRRLPGALTESKMIAAIVGTQDVLVDVEATEPQVRSLVQDRSVIHLATHGWLDELAPYASSLVLAGRDEITVAELVGLRLRADLAVLSACDTGRGAATLGGDVVGLTRAFLTAGVRRLLVSLWPVDDVTACVTMARFYEFLATGTPPAVALHQAQAVVRDLDEPALGAAYVAASSRVGTDARSVEGQARRRGEIVLPDELRDDEDIPSPLSGMAERHWAPFILVGAA